jgi:hypothetical protein
MWAPGDLPEDGVDEPALAPTHELDGLPDRGVRWDLHLEELVRTEAKGVPRSLADPLDGAVRRLPDRTVEDQQPSQGPIGHLRSESSVTAVESRTAEQRRDQEVRVGAFVDHAPDRLEGDGAGATR